MSLFGMSIEGSLGMLISSVLSGASKGVTRTIPKNIGIITKITSWNTTGIKSQMII